MSKRLDHRDATLGILLLLVFVARWIVSARSSYWFDELLSVAIYGVDHDSVGSAVSYLAKESIHPPLYQIILFYWMCVFGDHEVATRSLSNLYMTGASVCVYWMAQHALGRRRALAVTLFFALMAQPFYFAMETRSYAQSLFLVTLSSLLLMRILTAVGRGRSEKAVLTSPGAVGFVLVNVCLLMTHYYNAFFLGAQACFGLAFWLRRAWLTGQRAPLQLLGRALGLGAFFASPLALQLAIWGPVMANSYESRAKESVLHGATTSPLAAFADIGVTANFGRGGTSAWLLAAFGMLAALFYASRAVSAYKRPAAHALGSQIVVWYALATALGPFLFSFAAFAISKHERYLDRYFMFAAPSLAIMLVLALEHGAMLVARALPRMQLAHRYVRYSLLAHGLVLAVVILPGTYASATSTKEDWRGLAQRIVDITEQDKKHSYVLYATGFDDKPVLDYYLARLGAKLRPERYITRSEERRKKLPLKAEVIERHDFVLVAFTRPRKSKFPNLTKRLGSRYVLHQSLLHDDMGLLVYRVKKPAIPVAW